MDARTAFEAARAAVKPRRIKDFGTIQDGPQVLGWTFRTGGGKYGVQFGWVLADGRISAEMRDFQDEAEADGRRAIQVA